MFLEIKIQEIPRVKIHLLVEDINIVSFKEPFSRRIKSPRLHLVVVPRAFRHPASHIDIILVLRLFKRKRIFHVVKMGHVEEIEIFGMCKKIIFEFRKTYAHLSEPFYALVIFLHHGYSESEACSQNENKHYTEYGTDSDLFYDICFFFVCLLHGQLPKLVFYDKCDQKCELRHVDDLRDSERKSSVPDKISPVKHSCNDNK